MKPENQQLKLKVKDESKIKLDTLEYFTKYSFTV